MPPKRTTRSSPTKSISLEVVSDFKTDWYDAATPTERAEALELGMRLYSTMAALKATSDLKELEEKKNAEIEKLRANLAAAESSLKLKIEEAEAAAEQSRINTKKMMEKQAAELAASAEKDKERLQLTHQQRLYEAQEELRQLQEKCDALMERRRVLESGREEDIRVAEERTRALLQHALDEKERAILRAEKTVAAMNESIAKQSEELRNLGDLIRRKPTNVKTKGSEYEAIFREKLLAAFGLCERFSLTDSARSGIGHAGDYLMQAGDHTVLWEVKNYDKPVPTAEVDKFRRDMKENAQARVGVMVSRYTPITGRVASGDREIEFMDGKMLIYLSNFENMSEDTLPSLMLLFRLWWATEKAAADADDSKETVIRQIERLHTDALKAKTEWRLHKSRMDDALRWMAERVEESEHRLKSALNVLEGAHVSVEIPEGLFRDVSGDDKALRDIQTILRHTTVDKFGEVILNDLAELVAKEKSISRDTARAHIRSVMLDSAVDAPKGKSVRILGLKLKSAAILTHS